VLPTCSSRPFGDFPSPFGRQLLPPGCAAAPTERLCRRIFARIAHILFGLAGQNLGDPNRVGNSVGAVFSGLAALQVSLPS